VVQVEKFVIPKRSFIARDPALSEAEGNLLCQYLETGLHFVIPNRRSLPVRNLLLATTPDLPGFPSTSSLL